VVAEAWNSLRAPLMVVLPEATERLLEKIAPWQIASGSVASPELAATSRAFAAELVEDFERHTRQHGREKSRASARQGQSTVLTAAGYNPAAQAAMSEAQRAAAMARQGQSTVLTAAGYNPAAQAAMSEAERAAAMAPVFEARAAKDTGVRAPQPVQFRLIAACADAPWVDATSLRAAALAMGVCDKSLLGKKVAGLCGAFPQAEVSGRWLVRRRPEG